MIAVVGFLFWLFERRRNADEFGGRWWKGLGSGFWLSAVTMTTVGYGDTAPITPLGKVFASMVALSGIALVAMPTGIIAAAFSEAMQRRRDQRIEEMRQHLERLEEVDEAVESKLAALERTRNPGP